MFGPEDRVLERLGVDAGLDGSGSFGGAFCPYPMNEPTKPVAVLATEDAILYTAEMPRTGRLDPEAEYADVND